MKYDNKLKLYYIYESDYFFYGTTKEKKFIKKCPKYEHLENSTKKFLKIRKKVVVYVVVFTPKCFALHSANLCLL